MTPARPAPSSISTPVTVSDPFATAAPRTSVRDRLRVPDQAMAAAAALLLPLGLVLVMLSWWGAARTPYLFEQLPYLISGGLLGLGLVITGGFVLFGSWIVRTSREQQALSLELLEAVRSVRDEIAGLPAMPVGASKAGGTRKRGLNGSANASGLVATVNGSMLHRPDCVIVLQREDVHAVTSKEADGLTSCRLCDPLRAASV
ncbi:MAG: hypothetical protein Q8R60_01050 [Mycobacteriales bacterium]|nr:hypothetical protein [Mycobacteriales bacterium]